MNDRTEMNAATALNRLMGLMRAREQATQLNPVQWEALRFLSRANRFSASPKGTTEYLGFTKGTVSQTLIALEKKGLVEKRQAETDKRKVHLALTEAGESLLSEDPQRILEQEIASLSKSSAQDLDQALKDLLRISLVNNERRPFGICGSCRHFNRKHPAGHPHFCSLLDEALTGEDATKICLEHDAA